MKILLEQLIQFSKAHFTWKLLIAITGFLLICIAINYSISFYEFQVYKTPNKILKALKVSVFLMVPFLTVCWFVTLFTGKREWWSNIGFWIRLILLFGVWGISYVWHPLSFIQQGHSGSEYTYLARTTNKLESLVNVLLPVLVLYFLFEKENYKSLYGFRPNHWDWKPYLILWIALVITIGVGSFFGDLQAYYPRYLVTKGGEVAAARGMEEWLLIAGYEIAYGLNFISVELFFRGALVLAFTRYLGGYAVLAMVASYVFLHFGKPMTEAMSSAIGGYVLGIIALHSRNIWGGVVLHVSVAWLMEFYGWLQRYYQGT